MVTDGDESPLAAVALDARLSERQTEYLLLEREHGWSREAIAKRFGVQRHTVDAEFSRIRKRIQRRQRAAEAQASLEAFVERLRERRAEHRH